MSFSLSSQTCISKWLWSFSILQWFSQLQHSACLGNWVLSFFTFNIWIDSEFYNFDSEISQQLSLPGWTLGPVLDPHLWPLPTIMPQLFLKTDFLFHCLLMLFPTLQTRILLCLSTISCSHFCLSLWFNSFLWYSCSLSTSTRRF